MILVSGTSGFIGAAIKRVLSNDVIGLQRKKTQNTTDILECDLTDRMQVDAVIEKLRSTQITSFIHTAAVTPWSGDVDFSRDLVMAESVDRICKTLAIPQLVLLSGWNVYDMSGSAPFAEDTPIAPIGEYGASKYALEEYFRINTQETQVLNLRLASVYGQGQVSSGLIPNLVTSAISQKMISLQGVATKRDYLYIDDLAEAIKQLVDGDDSAAGELNLGSGQSVSVTEVAETIKDILAKEYTIDVDVTVPALPQESVPIDNQLDIHKAQQRNLLRETTSISEGLSRYIKWRIDENIL